MIQDKMIKILKKWLILIIMHFSGKLGQNFNQNKKIQMKR
jgi:hypothetical protein